MKYLLLLSLLTLYSCEQWKQTELELFENNDHIKPIIEGGITTELKVHCIRLTETIIENEKIIIQGISDANVRIISSDTLILFRESETPGEYISNDKCRAKIGNKYLLKVRMDNVEYEASDSVVNANEIFDEDLKLPDQDKGVISDEEFFFNLSKHDFGYQQAHMWYWQMPNENRSNILNFKDNMNFTHNVYDHSALFSNEIIYLGISGLSSDTINIYKYSISDLFYEYLYALFSETDWKTSFFSKTPGNLPGNISNNGYGFFYACDVKKGWITIDSLL